VTVCPTVTNNSTNLPDFAKPRFCSLMACNVPVAATVRSTVPRATFAVTCSAPTPVPQATTTSTTGIATAPALSQRRRRVATSPDTGPEDNRDTLVDMFEVRPRHRADNIERLPSPIRLIADPTPSPHAPRSPRFSASLVPQCVDRAHPRRP